QNNGGSTDTLGVIFTSAAVNHVPANASGCGGTDQRDVARPQGPGCDVGAYEFAIPVEGAQFSRLLVNPSCQPGPAPSVDGGDGTSSAGTFGGPNDTTIGGSHTYAEEGTYSVTVPWTENCRPKTLSAGSAGIDPTQ